LCYSFIHLFACLSENETSKEPATGRIERVERRFDGTDAPELELCLDYR
jgi:hypothetical protein